jgi:hypothetical protein
MSLPQPSSVPSPIQCLFSLKPLRETAQRSTDTFTAFLPLSTLHSLGLQPVRILFVDAIPDASGPLLKFLARWTSQSGDR